MGNALVVCADNGGKDYGKVANYLVESMLVSRAVLPQGWHSPRIVDIIPIVNDGLYGSEDTDEKIIEVCITGPDGKKYTGMVRVGDNRAYGVFMSNFRRSEILEPDRSLETVFIELSPNYSGRKLTRSPLRYLEVMNDLPELWSIHPNDKLPAYTVVQSSSIEKLHFYLTRHANISPNGIRVNGDAIELNLADFFGHIDTGDEGRWPEPEDDPNIWHGIMDRVMLGSRFFPVGSTVVTSKLSLGKILKEFERQTNNPNRNIDYRERSLEYVANRLRIPLDFHMVF